MKVVVAPDKLKGSLSAVEASRAMREGVRRADPSAEVKICPMSDGGEGFADVLVTALGGQWRTSRVTGPEGKPVEARWGMLEGGVAVVESALAIGHALVEPGRGQGDGPSGRTTFGLGELVLEAIDAGATTLLIGLGGSVTADAGVGMAQSLGVVFEGVGRPFTGAQLGDIRALDLRARDPRVATLAIRVATDVDNPLRGLTGSARVFAPQKGADAAEVERLEAGLVHLTTVAGDAGCQPGDGAAGGLGYGLRIFAGASIESGAELVLDAVGFDAQLDGCDLVLTGEGRLDAQTARGKVVAGVARRCKVRGVPVAAMVGSMAAGDPVASALRELGLTAWFSLCDGPRGEAYASAHAAELLVSATENAVRLFASRRGGPSR
ncbi:MAG TPA: glycerate kinase [Polyangiaceae bacterium]|nr:glycerate kinase [Polyangiaceae bacterium]